MTNGTQAKALKTELAWHIYCRESGGKPGSSGCWEALPEYEKARYLEKATDEAAVIAIIHSLGREAVTEIMVEWDEWFDIEADCHDDLPLEKLREDLMAAYLEGKLGGAIFLTNC